MADDKILKRIRALLNMTLENGASESEALFAAQKAGELINEHNINMTEIEMGEMEFGEYRVDHNGDNMKAVDLFVNAISDYLGIRSFVRYKADKRRRIQYVCFFGDLPSCQIAEYLYRIAERAIEAESDNFKVSATYINGPSNGLARKTLLTSFQAGMVSRLHHRIKEMKININKSNNSSQNALVLCKEKKINEEYQKHMGGKTGTKQLAKKTLNSEAFYEGVAAANTVNLNVGVQSNNSDVKMLAA